MKSRGAGNLEIWKSRALGLEIWKSGDLELCGWKSGNLEDISWKFVNGVVQTQQRWILGASMCICIYILYIYVCMYLCLYACMYRWMCVRVCVCVREFVSLHIFLQGSAEPRDMFLGGFYVFVTGSL